MTINPELIRIEQASTVAIVFTITRAKFAEWCRFLRLEFFKLPDSRLGVVTSRGPEFIGVAVPEEYSPT